MTISRLSPFFVAFLLTACGTASYQIQPEEASLKPLVERWVAKSGKTLVWEIDDLAFVRTEGLNRELADADTLPKALTILLSRSEASRRVLAETDRNVKAYPVNACIYPEHVVIRYQGAGVPCSRAVPAQN